MNNTEPFGALSNGAQITGSIDRVHPSHRTGIVSAQIGDDWRLMAQDEPALVYIDGDGVQLEDVTIEQLNNLRSLLKTSIPEQMIAAAVAYGRGDAAPPIDAVERTLDLILAGANAPEPAYEVTRRKAAAEIDRALAERFPEEFSSLSPRVRQLAVELEQAADQAPAFVDDDPTVTVVDDGQRSGIKLERYDWHERGEEPRIWLEFSAGRSPSGVDRPLARIDVDILGGRPGVELTVDGSEINSYKDEVWTLADVRQLRDDLDRLLRDERLIGALAEQHDA